MQKNKSTEPLKYLYLEIEAPQYEDFDKKEKLKEKEEDRGIVIIDILEKDGI